ncbi:hypothetical protein NEPAR04_1542 [Nematocida parisii]|nr:hypothetical protein NEPAR03_1801 [Nematocida parisii]KAI5129961.1 hypothetical protein NEPAR08_1780 [Nematocida parisii]KAI5142619.1 hypothetical protein NEPAR04_1542 [Nematocida parisii]
MLKRTNEKIIECSLENICRIPIDKNIYLIITGKFLCIKHHESGETILYIYHNKKKLAITYTGRISHTRVTGQVVHVFCQVVKIDRIRRVICLTLK